jgi:2-dehydro-3-deoxygalactonokinase
MNAAAVPRAAYGLADWGTTHLRVWLTDRAGTLLGERISADGMGVLSPDQFSGVLERHMEALGAPAGLPVVICGMAGSRQGWREAAYAETPVALPALAKQATAFQSAGRPVRIMPGVARRDVKRPDVMRGEETQLLGLGVDDGVACLPGTHSKWVRIEGGRIVDFATVMTGEMYSLLTRQSILRHATTGPDGATPGVRSDDPLFREAAAAAQDGGGVLSRLFAIRAASLLNGRDAAQSAASLSGLLIGAEIAEAGRLIGGNGTEDVHIIGSGPLCALYRAALLVAGRASHAHDGGALVRAGLLAAANRLLAAETQAAE